MWPVADMWRRWTTPPRGPYSAPEPLKVKPALEPAQIDVRPVTMPEPIPTSLMMDSLQIARGQVGVREVPPDSNRGPDVERYLASVGRGPGDSWCAAFCYWCILQAWRNRHEGWTPEEGSPPAPFPRTAWTHEVLLWGSGVPGRLITPTEIAEGKTLPAGAAFLMWGSVNWGTGQGVRHIGFVDNYDALSQEVHSIEGNTNTAGSREGGGVYRLTRPLESVYRFVAY